MTTTKDKPISEVYTERNVALQLAAEFARRLGYKVGFKSDPALADAADWPVLFIELPQAEMSEYGQLSWHIPAIERMVELPEYDGEWDGHTDLAKMSRMVLFLMGEGVPLEQRNVKDEIA